MSDTIDSRLMQNTFDQIWHDYHRMKLMERRLIAMGRSDIVDEADEYADERMKI